MKLAIVLLLLLAGSQPSFGSDESAVRETVVGIGGLFFRAEDPTVLWKWYEERLGVSPVPTDYEQQPWTQEAGPTVFTPFDKETEYFGRPQQV